MIWASIIIGSIFIADAIREVNGIKPWFTFGDKKDEKDKVED